MTNETTTSHATDFDPVERVKNQITDYIDFLVSSGELKITKVNSHNLSFELCATAARYALEDQHEPPSKNFTQIVGDLHTSAATRQYLNITQGELDQLVEDHLILKVTDSSGRNGYPAFQFKNGTVRPEIQKLIKPHLDYTYPENPKKHIAEPWEVALHLTTRSLLHGGYSISDYLTKYPEQLDREIKTLQHDLHKRAYAY
jgi:hypothetical protein